MKRIVEELDYSCIGILSSCNDVQESNRIQEADIIISDVKLGNEKFVYDALGSITNLPPVILFSSYLDIELYEKCKVLKPYIYLVKPIDQVTLKSAIEGAISQKRIKTTNDLKVDGGKVFVKSKGKFISINPSELLFVKSEGNYCYLNLEDSKIVIRSSLVGVIETLNSDFIVRVQRAYAVNIRKITNVDISKEEIELNNTVIPIGRKYKKALISNFKDRQ